MAGLIEQGMQPQQPPQGQPPQDPGGPPPQGQPPEGGQQGGEREQFEPLVESMLGFVYGKGLERIEGILESGEPAQSMGQVVGMVMATVYNMLSDNGRTVQPNVMVRAGIKLSKAIGEMAMEMGVLQQGEDDAIEMAFLMGLGQFGKTANDMAPEEKQEYARIARGLKEGKQAAQGGQQQGNPQQGGQPPQSQGMRQGNQPPRPQQRMGGM